MRKPDLRVIVFGYGNPGRLDDGLGPVFAERFAGLGLPGVDTEADYQLNVEDGARIAEYDVAVFVDASTVGREPFFCTPLTPAEDVLSISSHHLSPEQVVGIATGLFQAQARCYLLGIRGYRYNEFEQRLSDRASENLDAAVAFLKQVAESGWRFLDDRVQRHTSRQSNQCPFEEEKCDEQGQARHSLC